MSLTAGHWRYLEHIGVKYSLSFTLSLPHPTLRNHIYRHLFPFLFFLISCQPANYIQPISALRPENIASLITFFSAGGWQHVLRLADVSLLLGLFFCASTNGKHLCT